MKKTLLTIGLLLTTIAQGQVAISLSQGENTLIRLELQDFKRKNGYMTAGIENEAGKSYNRYALFAGYTFDNLFIRNLELRPLIAYSGVSYNGIYGSLTVGYRLSDTNIRFQVVNQYTDKYSAFVGVSYTFGKN